MHGEYTVKGGHTGIKHTNYYEEQIRTVYTIIELNRMNYVYTVLNQALTNEMMKFHWNRTPEILGSG